MHSPQQNSGHRGPVSFLDDTTGHMSQVTGRDSAYPEGLHGERTRGSWLLVFSGPHPMRLFPSLTSFASFGVIHLTHEHNYILSPGGPFSESLRLGVVLRILDTGGRRSCGRRR